MNLKDSIGFYIGFTARTLRNALNKAFYNAGYSITLEQWHILMCLWQNDGSTQSEIGRICLKDKTTLTRLISGMVKHGYIYKAKDKQDKRRNLIFLSEKGSKSRPELMSLALSVIEKAVQGFSSDDISALKADLEKINKNLSESIDEYIEGAQ